MFDFENLSVYQKAKEFNAQVRVFIKTSELDRTTNDQLRRTAFSIVLNIAEGAGRFTNPDKRNFHIIARGSVFECVAIFDVLQGEEILSQNQYKHFYAKAEELSEWGAGPRFRQLTDLRITGKKPFNEQDRSIELIVDIEVYNRGTGPFIYNKGKVTYECFPPPALKDFGNDLRTTKRRGLQVIVLFDKRGKKEVKLKSFENNWM